MLSCPSCEQRAMPWYRKAFLGSARTVPCDHCGHGLSVSGKANMLSAFPVIVAVLIAQIAGLDSLMEAVVLGGVVGSLIQILFVPLILRD